MWYFVLWKGFHYLHPLFHYLLSSQSTSVLKNSIKEQQQTSHESLSFKTINYLIIKPYEFLLSSSHLLSPTLLQRTQSYLFSPLRKFLSPLFFSFLFISDCLQLNIGSISSIHLYSSHDQGRISNFHGFDNFLWENDSAILSEPQNHLQSINDISYPKLSTFTAKNCSLTNRLFYPDFPSHYRYHTFPVSQARNSRKILYYSLSHNIKSGTKVHHPVSVSYLFNLFYTPLETAS